MIENQIIEDFYIEKNLRKMKWFPCGTDNPHRKIIGNNPDSLSKILALPLLVFYNYIVVNDFD